MAGHSIFGHLKCELWALITDMSYDSYISYNTTSKTLDIVDLASFHWCKVHIKTIHVDKSQQGRKKHKLEGTFIRRCSHNMFD